MPVASPKFIKEDAYDRKASMAILFGVEGRLSTAVFYWQLQGGYFKGSLFCLIMLKKLENLFNEYKDAVLIYEY